MNAALNAASNAAKIFLVTLAVLAPQTAVIAQQTRTMTTFITGSGSATESDRGSAIDEATQTAQNWANSTCIGTVVAVNTTSSNCIKLGSDADGTTSFTCMVFVKATCEIPFRGR